MTIATDNNNSPAQIFSQLPAGSVRILQVTDTHLYADPTRRLAGLNTDESLLQLLEIAKQRILPVDLVLVTGDLVHDATASGYQRIRDYILTLNAPALCIPGNHDLNPIMQENVSAAGIGTDAVSEHGDWVVIMLDSTIPGQVKGHLSTDQLEQLKSALDSHPNRHILVSLHHHPISLDSAWIDKIALNNPEELFSILDRYNNVRGLLWGHAHQLYEGERKGVKLMGSPSTCIQFKVGQDKFGIDPAPPGLRWLALLPDGKIETGVEYLEDTPEGLDLTTKGY
jgi:3',5'-cyclic-AMP phosphodiesterase